MGGSVTLDERGELETVSDDAQTPILNDDTGIR